MGARLGKSTYNMSGEEDDRHDKTCKKNPSSASAAAAAVEAENDSESDGGKSETTTGCSSWKSSTSSSDKSKKKKRTNVKKEFFGKRGTKSRWLTKSSKRETVDEAPPSSSISCVCTGYRRRDSEEPTPGPSNCASAGPSVVPPRPIHIDMSKFDPSRYPIEDEDERLRKIRLKEIEQGLEVSMLMGLKLEAESNIRPHSQIDYIHCLVPDLKEITNCSFYWGKIDRYEAEKLLEGKPEGTFLLRDSAQEEYLFSVSFRRYGRSLHARIEQWNHAFSFDSHDPSVFSSSTVTGLIEHYKDPMCCMFFEPLLTTPLHRNFTFDLQHLARSIISSRVKYDEINDLALPKVLKDYCQEYHYKQRVRYRKLEL